MFLSFFFLLIFSFANLLLLEIPKHFLAKHSKYAKLYQPWVKSGIGVTELISMLKNTPVDSEVKNIFISIGVNDDYNDKGIYLLIEQLDFVFPNSYFFVVQGSYGWGNVMNVNPQSKRYVGLLQ